MYCAEASLLGAEFVAHNLGISVHELCGLVYDEVKRKLYLNIVAALLENKYPDYMKNGVPKEIIRFINENFHEAKNENFGEDKNGNHDEAKTGKRLLSVMFGTGYSLIGMGAPISVFIEDVAKMLGTNPVIPKHYEVANALGAIMGSVSASHSVEVSPNIETEGPSGYAVFGNNGKRIFKEMDDAIGFAAKEAKEGARAEAAKRGAAGELAVTLDIDTHDAEAKDCVVYLGTTVTARAAGTIGFR
jgi:hypothetical protein